MSRFPLTKGNCKYRVWASGRRCAFAIQRQAGPFPRLARQVFDPRTARTPGAPFLPSSQRPHPQTFLGHSDPLSPLSTPAFKWPLVQGLVTGPEGLGSPCF